MRYFFLKPRRNLRKLCIDSWRETSVPQRTVWLSSSACSSPSGCETVGAVALGRLTASEPRLERDEPGARPLAARRAAAAGEEAGGALEWMSPRRLTGRRPRGVPSAEDLYSSRQRRLCSSQDRGTHGGKNRGSLEAVLRGARLPRPLDGGLPLVLAPAFAKGDVTGNCRGDDEAAARDER